VGSAARHAARLLILLTLILLAACGGDDGDRLDATRMTLELRFPHVGPAEAVLSGRPNAAPEGVTVVCRKTDGDQRELGRAAAGGDGAFRVPLDPTAYPVDIVAGGQYMELNQTLECRTGDGPWVKPLRPPLVAIE
jgi:hypothetical protein